VGFGSEIGRENDEDVTRMSQAYWRADQEESGASFLFPYPEFNSREVVSCSINHAFNVMTLVAPRIQVLLPQDEETA
jgi:hypothetical protein